MERRAVARRNAAAVAAVVVPLLVALGRAAIPSGGSAADAGGRPAAAATGSRVTLPAPAAASATLQAPATGRSVPPRASDSGSRAALPAPGALEGSNLLLVTVDTLRADALGAYGGPDGLTPELDRIAAAGVRFDAAFAHAPTTLPSHASILTGQYPYRHGVRDNGAFRLDPASVTLAEVLRGAGYRTAAFVGAFVLDVRFGLGQGFDLYDDYYGERGDGGDFRFQERRAGQVLAAAAEWIESAGGPWFAWIHLFDPHAPYEPPEGHLRDRRQRPYDGEVAYVDAELGRFLERLRSSGALDGTLGVFTADHGESLGEHGEQTHGAFAYNATLRVPLLLWGPRLQAGAVSVPVGHVDIVPTVLELLGRPVPEEVQGMSLLDGRGTGSAGADARAIYFEALSGYLTQNLAPLTGIVEGDYKFTDLPVPELYHLPTDPGERHNLIGARPQVAARLRGALEQQLEPTAVAADETATLDGLGRAALGPIDEATRRRLRSLGYLAATALPSTTVYTADDDPKHALPLIEKHRSAAASFSEGRPAEAIGLLREILDARPRFTVASLDLASILYAAGRRADAVAVLEAALEEDPHNPRVAGKLGFFLASLGAADRGLSLLEGAVERLPWDVGLLEALAIAYTSTGRLEDARALLERALELDPSSASARHNLGLTYARQRDFERAIEHFRLAIELAPDFWPAHEGMGSALAVTGRLAEAVEAWKRMLELDPGSYDALYNLGLVLARLGRNEEALTYLDRFAREAPPDTDPADIEKVRGVAAQLRARIQ